MGRPRKYLDGTRVFSFSVGDERLSQYLENFKEGNPGEFSAMICRCVSSKLGSADRELLNLQLQACDLQLAAARREVLRLEEDKVRLQAKLRDLDLLKEKITERRLQLLERGKRSGWLDSFHNFEGFATGPAGVELIAACGFEDPAQAHAWMKEQAELIKR